jgi:hypothetical protein
LKEDRLKLRGIHLTDEIIFKHNILGIKLKDGNNYIKDNFPYLGIINSMLVGFFLFNISSQWGKGEEKRAALRNVDLEKLPIKKIHDKKTFSHINKLLKDVNLLKNSGANVVSTVNEIDELIFNLYELTEYEKEIIKEFYQINVDRSEEKLLTVQSKDIIEYFNAFKETFSLVLSPEHTINASFNISQNLGAIIKITIEEKSTEKELAENNTLQVLQFVKNKQLTETDKLLKEEKIKIYEPHHFYLIKSNQFKDWTKRQAIKDAKEEIELLLLNLPDSNDE